MPDRSLLVVDAIRIDEQVAELRNRFGRRVVHLHLQAAPDDLAARYPAKRSEIDELVSAYEARYDLPPELPGALSPVRREC